MKEYIKNGFICELWKDFYDSQWRIKISFLGYEIVRFKVEMSAKTTFSGIVSEPIISRVKKGYY